MIFLRATRAPVFLDLARWTSLAAMVLESQLQYHGLEEPRAGAQECLPKGTLAEFAQDLIVGDARAAHEAAPRPLVGDGKAAR